MLPAGEVANLAYLELRLLNEAGQPKLSLSLIQSLLNLVTTPIQADVILITGNKQAFCTGLDIESLVDNEWNDVDIKQALTSLSLLLDKLAQSPLPVIACVEGPALGGGLGFVAVADLVLATPTVHFALPETIFGLIPAVVFPHIVRRIGLAKARLLALGAQPCSAETAKQMGLVDDIDVNLATLMQRYLKRFKKTDRQATGMMKRLIAEHFAIFPDYYEQAIQAFSQLLISPNTQARIKRFQQGKSPWEEGEEDNNA